MDEPEIRHRELRTINNLPPFNALRRRRLISTLSSALWVWPHNGRFLLTEEEKETHSHSHSHSHGHHEEEEDPHGHSHSHGETKCEDPPATIPVTLTLTRTITLTGRRVWV